MCYDAEKTLGSREKPDQVEAGFVFVGATAAGHHFAVRQHDRETKNVAAGHAVFQAARTTGVGGDVSAYAAILEAGGVRWIEEIFFAGSFLEFSCDDPRLNHGHEIACVDLNNPVHSIHAEHDAALHGGAAADIPIAGTAWRDRYARTISLAENECCLLGIGRKNHCGRCALGEPFVGGIHRRDIIQHTVSAEFFAEFPKKRGVHDWRFAWKKCQDSATPSAAGFEAR